MINSWKKCTLVSSTFKVEENKVPLFFRTDVIWGRYEFFVIIRHVRGFSVFPWNDKMITTHQDNSDPDNKCTFISSIF